MPRYFLHFAYKGTGFHGWQRQDNAISVQASLEQALHTLLRQNVPTVGQGRTDTGVHANQCFAHFDTECLIKDYHQFVKSLNAILPDGIVIFEVFMVPLDAHARFSATSRTYEYHMHRGKNPFRTEISASLKQWPKAEPILEAIPYLLGKRDFGSFAKSGSHSKTNICDLKLLNWDQKENDIVLTVKADRFLRNMVRAITGTLLEVGYGKKQPSDIPVILSSASRSSAGESVPAEGLFLTKVEYPEWVFSLRHGG